MGRTVFFGESPIQPALQFLFLWSGIATVPVLPASDARASGARPALTRRPLLREEPARILEGLELEGVAGRVEEEHCRLLADLVGKRVPHVSTC